MASVKLFLSWSGERSQAVATALSHWLPDTFHDVEVWMSGHAISAGARWGAELSSALEATDFGVLCLTPENLSAPWILFEAGSLAKAAKVARVVPYLLELSPSNIEFPLAQFQGVHADEQGTFQLLESINNHRSAPLDEGRLRRTFVRWWPDLEMKLRVIPLPKSKAPPPRSERELLEELLELVRKQPPEPTVLEATLESLSPIVGNAPSAAGGKSPHIGVSKSKLSRAEEYAVNKFAHGASTSEVVAGLERQGLSKRFAEEMTKELWRGRKE